ncbi:MAG: hypothetical protein AWU57_28 [Marinobacter sp. T13-3]|nr:MAG: hypothetical protein AWU57_28 [Marinobacter sp. T13-3]
MTTLSAKEQHNFNVLQSLHDQGYEIHLGGPGVGALTVHDSLNAFNRNHQHNFSDGFIDKVNGELNAVDDRMDLKTTQAMLKSQERAPLGIYRTLLAQEDRARFGDASLDDINDLDDDPSGPSMG